jgi:tetratricopeptide (TPR) repeat protein
MKFKQSLIEESSGADGTSLEIARALKGFAITQRELGLFNEASVTLQQAIAAVQSLDEGARSSTEVQSEMIDMLHTQAGVLSHLNRKEEALESIRQSVVLGERLLQSNPKHNATMVRLGNLLMNQASSSPGQESRKQLNRAVELERTAVAAEPNNGHFQFELALALETLAMSYANSDDVLAKTLMQESIVYNEQLLPRNRIPRTEAMYFARACRGLSGICVRKKEFAEAEVCLQKGLDVLESSTHAFPNYCDGRAEYAYCLLQKARLSMAQEDFEAADSDFVKLMREVAEIKRLFPDDAYGMTAYAFAKTDWGRRLETLKRYGESAEVSLDALLQYNALRQKSSNNRAFSFDFAKIGSSLVQLANSTDDESIRKDILTRLGQLLKDDAIDLNSIAWRLVKSKSATQEDAAFAMVLATRAMAISPDDSNIHNTLGVALFRSGKPTEARVEFENSLSLKTPIPGADWYFLAMLSHAEGKSTESAEFLQKAKQWRIEKRPNDEELKGFETEAVDFMASVPHPPG